MVAYGGVSILNTTTLSNSLTSSNQAIKNPAMTIKEQANSNPNKSCITKPRRKRYRASKKTPTTVLNANPSNFRSLVQQFTGSPNVDLPSSGYLKGPLRVISFGGEEFYDHNNKMANDSMMSPFGCPNNFQYQNQAVHLQQKQQQVQENLYHPLEVEDKCLYTKANIASDVFVDQRPPNVGYISDHLGFVMDDSIFLDELLSHSSSSYII
ncbi:VQ protein [Dillenia turbinata]|uniref:VQ protein n=1 Tax=Dillenia turbinata TaxID=194707 RepID=A0AAN8VCP4_9MAGN